MRVSKGVRMTFCRWDASTPATLLTSVHHFGENEPTPKNCREVLSSRLNQLVTLSDISSGTDALTTFRRKGSRATSRPPERTSIEPS